MAESKFDVILTGEIAEGHHIEVVKGRLADIFKKDILTIGELLQRKNVVIRKNADEKTAEKYAASIKTTGAIYRIDSSRVALDEKNTVPEEKELIERPIIISAQPKPGNAQYSYHGCNKITGLEDGINLNKKDIAEISFGDIFCVSVFRLSENGDAKVKLLLFIKEKKRPFLIDAQSIEYQGFPLPKAVNMLSSLRNFVFFISSKNKSIIMDKGTFDFLSGNQPNKVDFEILKFSTALGHKIFFEDPLVSEVGVAEIERVFDGDGNVSNDV